MPKVNMLPNKKVLITGGAGFIGSHIVDKLILKNYQIVIIDNLSSGSKDNLQKSDLIKLYELDIENDNIEEVFEVEHPDYIIHLAAQTSVNYSIANSLCDANLNILATIRLLELAKKYNVKKFIASSSAAVYGTPKYLPLDENHPTEPISPYGLSKLTMEKYIQLSGVPYTIYRFSNVYGPRQKSSKESGVIAIFHDAMKNNKPINIYGDGNQIRDYVYVEDIAEICVMALENDVNCEIINVSTNIAVSLNGLFDFMKNLYGYKQNAKYLPRRTGDIENSILDNSKLIKLFTQYNKTTLSVGLNKLLCSSMEENKCTIL